MNLKIKNPKKFPAFACHEQGASSLIYAPQHQLLISAGKKGDVCIFDVRQRSLRHRFQAHESAIKCLAIDPHEEHFVTGSADGDIRVSFTAISMDLMMKADCIRFICDLICFNRYGAYRFIHHCIRSLVSMQRAASSNTLARV